MITSGRTHIILKYEGGPPKNLELFSAGQAALKYRLPLLSECSRKPSLSVCQLAQLGEAVFDFSEFCFEDIFSAFAHFMMGDFLSVPAHTALSVR